MNKRLRNIILNIMMLNLQFLIYNYFFFIIIVYPMKINFAFIINELFFLLTCLYSLIAIKQSSTK